MTAPIPPCACGRPLPRRKSTHCSVCRLKGASVKLATRRCVGRDCNAVTSAKSHGLCWRCRVKPEYSGPRCACGERIYKAHETQCANCRGRASRPRLALPSVPHVPTSIYVQPRTIEARYQWRGAVCR